jgi:hypothetical protein
VDPVNLEDDLAQRVLIEKKKSEESLREIRWLNLETNEFRRAYPDIAKYIEKGDLKAWTKIFETRNPRTRLRLAQSIADKRRARQESDASALEVQGSQTVANQLQMIEKPNRSATDQVSMMTEDEIKYLHQLSQPTRSSAFLREFFEEAADGEFVQAEIAQAYKMFFGDENFLSAANFIRHIPKTFKDTSIGITKEPKPRYVVRGIRARSDRPDFVQKAADWLREQAERDAGDPMELDEVKPAEENKQAELVAGGLPFDWLQETEGD